MPRRGGEAAKAGFDYQDLWVVDAALDLIDGEATNLEVEPRGDEDSGIDLNVTRAPNGREYHSVKRRQPAGNWTISRLAAKGTTRRSILGDLVAKTQEGRRGVFCSGTSASDLEWLIEHARASNSWPDFEERIRSNARVSDDFYKHVIPVCNDSEEAAHAALTHLRVRFKNESELIRDVELRIRAMFRQTTCDPVDAQVVRLLIAGFVAENLGQQITSQSIRAYLETHGYMPSQLAGNRSVGHRLIERNRAHIAFAQQLRINGADIPRQEAAAAVRALLQLDQHVMLEGAAGAGKSCVAAQTVKQLAARDIPCLAIRLDLIPEGDLSAQAIGRRLDLPDSPVLTLGEYANGRPCVFCIDQLDALSIVSARQQTIWGPFNEMLNEAERYPNMRLLFACRTFDLEQDPRLRKLVAQQDRVERISIGPLDEDTVQGAIEASGVATVSPCHGQFQVLSNPLHLFLFLEASRAGPVDFTEAGDLFDAFWKHKRRSVDERVGLPGSWMPAVGRLCDALSERESLMAPRYALDDHAAVLEAMASEAVVQLRDDLVQFFHESFFDYAFARTFLGSNNDLVAWLVGDAQHLFRRSQVRQVLGFLRSHEPNRRRYLRTIKGLLGDRRIRFHIKKLVLAWMSELPDPTDAEWRILEELLPKLGDHTWNVVRDRVPWFDLLQEMGRWAIWLDSDDDCIDCAVWLLGMPKVLDGRSAVVAALVAPFQGRSDKWRDRLRWLAIRGHGYGSPEMQDLVIRLITDGTLDDARRGTALNDDWWLIWHSTANELPDFVARVLGAWFDRKLVRAVRREHDNPIRAEPDLAPRSQFSSEVIVECSSRAPYEFASEFMPRFARLESLTPRNWISAPSSLGSPEEQLRDALAKAMASLAVRQPEVLESLMAKAKLAESTWMSAVILQAWSSNPEFYADRIVCYLLDRPVQRLSIGYSISNPASDAFMAISRTAVASASAHCSDESFAKLELAILHFTTARERRNAMVGRTELALLRALSIGRLSDVSRRRIRELKLRFPHASERGTPEPPAEPYVVSVVGPPIPEPEQRQLTDDEWLSAMAQYATGWESDPNDVGKGGAIELSRGLQTVVRGAPERFTRLTDRMDASLHPAYFEAILQGLSRTDDQGCGPGTLSQVCTVLRRIAGTGADVGRAEIARAIGALAHVRIPDDILTMLGEIARHDADPRADDWQLKEPAYAPMDQAINSARGAAAYAMSILLFADRDRWATYCPVVEQLACDPVLAVRVATVPCLLAVLDANRDDALEGFGQLVDGAEAILGADEIVQFVHYAMYRDYNRVRPVLQRMLESPHSEVAVAGATQLAIAALSIDEASEDLDHLVQLSEQTRIGVAEVCAANIANDALARECERRLRTFFSDDSPDVRRVASTCWNYLEPDQIASRGPLIRVFAKKLRPGDEASMLLFNLREAKLPLPAELCDLAERAVVAFGDRAASIRFGEGGDAHGLSELMVRLYEETNDDAVRTRALDAIDDMVQAGFIGIDDRLRERFHR